MAIELLSAFETWGRNKGKALNTVKTYRGVLENFNEWLETHNKSLTEITRVEVQDYMDYLDKEQNRSASTLDKVFACIRVFSQFSNKPDIIKNIKIREKKKNIYQSTPDVLNEREKVKLLKEVEDDSNLRNKVIIHMLLYTGIRISELCALNHSDIELRGQKGILIVRSSGSRQQRNIPLPKETVFHLRKYLDSIQNREGALFTSTFNKRVTPRAVQYMLKRYGINPHKLRHTFCQDLVNKGMDVSVVAQLAGYNDINMTKRYKRL